MNRVPYCLHGAVPCGRQDGLNVMLHFPRYPLYEKYIHAFAWFFLFVGKHVFDDQYLIQTRHKNLDELRVKMLSFFLDDDGYGFLY